MDFLKMTIGEIASLSAFDNFEYLVAEENPMMAPKVNAISIEAMCKLMRVWDAASLAEGVEYLHEKATHGKTLYDIYAQEEKTDATSKTGIVAFPVPGGEKTPYVVICPGGSYQHCCKIQEGFPVAKKLNEMGIAAFVVQYRTGAHFDFEGAMEDVAHAVGFIRENADMFRVAADRYAIMGFSAGGHVAGLWGTSSKGYAAHGSAKPSGVILGYPAVSLQGMEKSERKTLIIKDWSEEAMHASSVYEQADGMYPRTFIWAFDDDSVVSPEKHKKLADTLREKDVPVKYESFPGTLHGVGLGDHTAAKGWLQRAVAFWLKAE